MNPHLAKLHPYPFERLRKLFEKPLPPDTYRTAVDPAYDVRAAREAEGRGRVAR